MISNYKAILNKVEPLARKFASIEGYETTALILEKKYKGVLDLIEEEVKKITDDQFELIATDIDEKNTAALLFYKDTYAESVRSFLWSENVSQLELPEEFSDKPFFEAVKLMRQQEKEIPEKIKKVEKKLIKLSSQWYSKLAALRAVLEDRLDELRVVERVGQTSYAFVIVGWVPTKYLPKLRKRLNTEFEEKVIVNATTPSKEELEEAPVVYENPFWAKSFEVVMRLFPPPKYGTVDPTPFIAIFYPLFFGMILGDVGYGLVLLIITLLVRRKFKDYAGVRAVATMLMMASFMVMFFGFLYGEFFGDIPHMMGWLKHVELHIGSATIELPFERNNPDLIIPFLIMCLSIGIAQIIIGQVIGLVNAIRERAQKHIMEKVGMLLLFVAFFLFMASTMKWFPQMLSSASFLILIIAFGLLAFGGGVLGVIHIFSTIGKIFSYLRLMALGLAGVILAIAANQMASAIGNIWAGILIALVFHMINVVVHTFSSTIHSLRLNFIEFFDQFFEAGGREYKPFKKAGVEKSK